MGGGDTETSEGTGAGTGAARSQQLSTESSSRAGMGSAQESRTLGGYHPAVLQGTFPGGRGAAFWKAHDVPVPVPHRADCGHSRIPSRNSLLLGAARTLLAAARYRQLPYPPGSRFSRKRISGRQQRSRFMSAFGCSLGAGSPGGCRRRRSPHRGPLGPRDGWVLQPTGLVGARACQRPRADRSVWRFEYDPGPVQRGPCAAWCKERTATWATGTYR